MVLFQATSAPKIATLTWWGCLCAPMSLRAMLAGPFEVLVGTPMPDRSKVRGQKKSNLPALQVWGFCIGLTTLSCKKTFVTETATCNLQESSVQNDPPESMPWTTVNAESEITRNSAGNRIRMTDSGQSHNWSCQRKNNHTDWLLECANNV